MLSEKGKFEFSANFKEEILKKLQNLKQAISFAFFNG